MARQHVWALIIFLLFIANQPGPATCEIFHIIPSENSPCPGELTGEPCFILSQYMNGEYRKYTSDPSEIILEFQSGRHTAAVGHNTFASQLVSFSMNSVNLTEIYCPINRYYTPPSRISQVYNVHISGIEFIQCSYHIESVINFTLEKSSFSEVQYYNVLNIGSSSVTIKGCNFTNNNNVVVLRVDSSSESISVDYSSFSSNMGSIIIDNVNGYRKNVIISNSHFSNTGALSAFVSYLELYNTTFVYNRGNNGGALAVQNTQSIVNITQCNFVGNTAQYRGGAIYSFSSTVIIQNSTFSSNGAGLNRWFSNAEGGAIHATGSSATLAILQSRFMNNGINTNGHGRNNGKGGAIFVSGTKNSLSIIQSKFMNNRLLQAGNGNAIHVYGDKSSVSVYQSVIGKHHIQTGNGGAVYIDGSSYSVSLYQSIMEENNIQTGNGGAMFLTGNNGHILIVQSSISNNKALTRSGGAIHTNGLNTSILIIESTMSNNSATECGALDINDVRHYYVKFKNSTFMNNSAITKSGGVMCIRNVSISILDSSFSHNRAVENAGVFVADDSKITILGSTFDSNTAGANGGVLNSEYFHISLFTSHTSFTNNQAAINKGV